MEELKHLAGQGSLDDEPAELAIGGFLSVLKKSKNLEKENFQKIMDCLDDNEEKQGTNALKKYERAVTKNSLPNPAMMLLPRPDFAPPGPPPWVIAEKVGKGITTMRRKDKDAGNTQDAIAFLVAKKGLEEESIVTFIPVFTVFVKKEVDVDIGEILRLPPTDEDETEERAKSLEGNNDTEK